MRKLHALHAKERVIWGIRKLHALHAEQGPPTSRFARSRVWGELQNAAPTTSDIATVCRIAHNRRLLAHEPASWYNARMVGGGEPREAGRPPARKKETNMRKNTTPAREEPATMPSIDEMFAPATPEQEAADDAEIEEQIEKKRSVVKPKYKARYRDRAKAGGLRSKAAKRSVWDWLAQQLAGETLNKQGKLDVDKLVAILQANGEPDPLGRWDNRSKGWEGRLRMTGGLWLRTVVAEEGVLKLADGEELVPPEEWVKTILKV